MCKWQAMQLYSVTAIEIRSISGIIGVELCQSQLTVALLTQLEELKKSGKPMLVRASRVEDMNEDSSTGGRVGLSHDVLNVFFDRLFSDQEGIGDFFIGPSLCQMFNN